MKLCEELNVQPLQLLLSIKELKARSRGNYAEEPEEAEEQINQGVDDDEITDWKSDVKQLQDNMSTGKVDSVLRIKQKDEAGLVPSPDIGSNTGKEEIFLNAPSLQRFKVTPFYLSTSPAVFQRLMDSVLHDLLEQEVFCYIDDIIICTNTKTRHLVLLGRVCEKLEQAGLRLKAKKCALLQSKVSFLGHLIDEEGLHMDFEKVAAVQIYEKPRNAKELRTFAGMTSYCRNFCLGFAKYAGCLFRLTSAKTKWSWEKEHERAFARVKEMIGRAPALAQPDVEAAKRGEKPFITSTS
ncbi:unnamed protein product [Nippostrongylus brasiliensis]|uniref:RNA-directed DNA polymerase n=1 Tax=Nippostrongylus brasiliensis TaxID=27835 RepID=A0A0N4YLE1_NIPBR|nr:unnamed protein product [Nippostrongylus brasiliensis]